LKKIIILTFIISVLCGCNRPVAETETAPALPEMSETEATKNLINDTSLNVAVIGTPCWNPHGEQQKINRDAMNFIYEPLYTLDSQLNPVPVLADRLEADGRTIRIYLKSGVTFHDGTELTPDDVAYSANFIVYNSSVYPNDGLIKASAKNGYVEFALTHPQPLPEKIFTFPIVKNKSEESLPYPVGTGPMKYVKKNGYDTFMLTFYENYHGTEPVFNQMTMISVKEEEQAKRLFEIGETDIIRTNTFSSVAPRANATFNEYISSKMVFIGFNTEKVPLSVRQAVYYGLDRRAVSENCFPYAAEFSNIPLNPSWNVLESIENKSPLDEDLADNVLQDDGYVTSEKSCKKDGKQLTLDVIIETGDEYKKIYDEFEKAMKQFGIKCHLTETDYYYERLMFGLYDVCIGAVRMDTDLNALLGEGNPFKYDNAEMRMLAENKETVKDALDIAMADVPIIPVCFEKEAVSVCSKFADKLGG